MTIDLFLVLVVIILGFAGLGWYLKQLFDRQQPNADWEAIVNQVFGQSSTKIAEQSKQILQGEKEAIRDDLAHKQQLMEKLVKELRDEIKTRQEEIRALEQDRKQTFGQLTSQLDQHRQLTKELGQSTEQLAKVLSNNQTRGAWGERIIEDLLQANGLIEGIHYARQAKLGDTALKPDITLLLPNHRLVPVDVKFPYAEIQKLSSAQTKSERDAHVKQFAQDLKLKIKKVAEYINPDQDTLDYAILFVPNEMVFSFLNQKFPDLVDEAMQARVIIVSPFTFIIVAKTVIESYRNFMMEDKLREVIKHISGFVSEWQKFKEQFAKYGRSIASLQTAYEELMGTRVRQMDRRIERIEEHQRGGLLESGE